MDSSGFLLLAGLCNAQQLFEGEIKYKVSVTPDDAKVELEKLKSYYGKQMTFLFKEGNFKWVMDSTSVFVGTVYNRDENKVYYQMKNSEVVAWRPGSQVTDSIISIKPISKKGSVMKRSCKILEVKSRSNKILRTRTYYYDPGLGVKPVWFAKTNNGNMNEVYAITKALPLKIVDDFGTFKITYEATEIIPRKLPTSTFKVESLHFVEVK